MASFTPEITVTQTHVFRVSSDMHRLELISPTAWRQIVHHALPLQPANAAVRLLILRGTAPNQATDRPTARPTDRSTDRPINAGAYCKSIDALQLQTDSFGFLLTWDASDTQSFPALSSLNQDNPRPTPEPQTQTQTQTLTHMYTRKRKPGKVIDSRQRFMRRYLSHRHNWQPSRPLIAEALIRSGYGEIVPDQTL